MLSDRIDALEARLMFQDETIETLNQTITAQWQKIDQLARQLVTLSDRLQETENRVPAPPTSRRRITEDRDFQYAADTAESFRSAGFAINS
jgi:SlyX protein